MGAQGPSSAQPLLSSSSSQRINLLGAGALAGQYVTELCRSSETSGSTWQNLIRGLRPGTVYVKVMGLPGCRFGPCPPPPPTHPLSLGWQEGFGHPTRPPRQPTDQEECRVSGPGWTLAWWWGEACPPWAWVTRDMRGVSPTQSWRICPHVHHSPSGLRTRTPSL